jgi:Ca2+-binding RTX toxin-like protein
VIAELAVVLVLAAQRPCTITGTSAGDVLFGTPGPDVICGLGGDDTISSGPGNDVIRAGPGADLVEGGPGLDIMRGGPGPDMFNARDGLRDVIDGGLGADGVFRIDGWDKLVSIERR